MFAAAFDPDRLELRGAPFPILEQVASSDMFGFASFDASRTGTWVYRVQDHATVNWLDNSGAIRPLLAEPGGYEWLHLSHDGSRLAFVLGGDVWIHDIARETRTRLVIDASAPLWTPDDRFIVFRHPEGLSWVRSDGGTPPQVLTRTKHVQLPFSFSGDGQRLSFDELNCFSTGVPGTCGPCRCGSTARGCVHRRRNRSSSRRSTNGRSRSRPTADGWPIPRTSRGAVRSTSGLSLTTGASGKSRPAAAIFPSGHATHRSCSSRARTA